MFQRFGLLRLISNFGAKKKKEADAVMLSSDIVNIFKDRPDPVPVPVEELPLFVHQLAVGSNVQTSTMQTYLSLGDREMGLAQSKRLIGMVKNHNKKYRSFYVQILRNKKGFKKQYEKVQPMNIFHHYDILSTKYDEMAAEQQAAEERQMQEAQNEQ